MPDVSSPPIRRSRTFGSWGLAGGAAFVVLVVSVACGGGGGVPRPANDAHGARTDEPVAQSAVADTVAPPAPPPRPRCDDGSCFSCGDGFCPNGFYCDDGAPGGAACAWVPACASSSCECVTRALRGGHCTTKGGGPHVGSD